MVKLPFIQQLAGIEIELQSAIEERNRARQDASESNLAQDEVVSKAKGKENILEDSERSYKFYHT